MYINHVKHIYQILTNAPVIHVRTGRSVTTLLIGTRAPVLEAGPGHTVRQVSLTLTLKFQNKVRNKSI